MAPRRGQGCEQCGGLVARALLQRLEQALQRIAANNQMSLSQFRDALQRDGIPFTRFREEIREEMTINALREREVDNRIVVTDSEIDDFLALAAQLEALLGHAVRKTGFWDSRRPIFLFFGEGYPALAPCHPNQ